MKRTGKRIISMLLCVLLASALSTTALAAEDGKVLKLAFTDSPTLVIGDMTIYHPSYAAMLAFKGAFEKSTGGEYSVELYPNGVLGDAASTMEQMLTGTITGSTPADGALSAFAPDIQVFTIPYLFDNPTIAYDVLDGDFGRQLFEKIAAETGFRVVASYDNGGYRNFTNSKREIRTAADMEGLNIRVQDSPVYLEMVEALGASATPVAFLELYSALQTGVVDGQENSCVTTLLHAGRASAGPGLPGHQRHVVPRAGRGYPGQGGRGRTGGHHRRPRHLPLCRGPGRRHHGGQRRPGLFPHRRGTGDLQGGPGARHGISEKEPERSHAGGQPLLRH